MNRYCDLLPSITVTRDIKSWDRLTRFDDVTKNSLRKTNSIYA